MRYNECTNLVLSMLRPFYVWWYTYGKVESTGVLSRSEPPSSYYKGKKKRITYDGELTYPQGSDYLDQLIESDQSKIVKHRPYQHYEITQKRRKCLRLFEELQTKYAWQKISCSLIAKLPSNAVSFISIFKFVSILLDAY